MKKLTVLLAAVMAFAFSANAYAANFSDIAEQPVKVQDSIAKTVALGIINGYEDGTFGPEQNITRAEFAKIAVTAAGAKDTADMLANNNSSFKDVKAAQWYTGWVNASESLGIFQGDGNGNFRPNDTITNQEVITVLMRLLGYNDNLTGTWPVNYVTQANKSEILDDVAVVAAAPATRADVVVMLDATLDTELVTYDKDTNEFVLKQTTKSDSSSKTLMQDSFKGTYFEVPTFDKVDQVKDFDKQTLNWDVTYDYVDNNGVLQHGGQDTVIIDKNTRVSYNGTSLFDLEGHQGNVYYVKEDGKLYARFIEVESYTKTVTDEPTQVGTKVKVNKTSYNAASDIEWTVNAGGKADGTYDSTVTPAKNSNYILYFNDDDQVYAVKSDKDFTETAYYVKSATSSTIKLVGSEAANKAISTSDDVLVYTEDGFVAPSELKVGDAVQKITDDLYVKVDEVTGTLTKKTTDDKYTIDGKSYKFTNATKQLDKEYEDSSDTEIKDIYGNEVSFILNKNNSISAMIIDDSSIGTKLYGIVMGGDGSTNGFGTSASATTVTLFTAEGKSVTYEYDSDVNADDKMKLANVAQLVEYKLNKDGEIKDITPITTSLLASDGDEIEIKDNKYLVGNGKTLTLASNVVIFEVDEDGDDPDPSVVTRSSLLAGGDFKPSPLEITNGSGSSEVGTYAVYALNTNGAIKVLAYTVAGASDYRYGVADGGEFSAADDVDRAIKFDGDDTEYELTNGSETFKNHDLVVYTKSSSKLNIVFTQAKQVKLGTEVKGYTDGLISFGKDDSDNEIKAKTYQLAGTSDDDTVFNAEWADLTTKVNSVKTDEETIVYVMNSSTGYYELGDLDSISKGAYVQILVTDDEGYADVVIVDEYNTYTQN